MISPLLTRPQGWQGCQKIRKTKLKTTLVTWSAKIQPKLNKIRKTFKKQGFFENFCSILMVFHSFFNFGWILALQLTRVDFSLVVWTGGVSIVEWNEFWSFRSLCHGGQAGWRCCCTGPLSENFLTFYFVPIQAKN